MNRVNLINAVLLAAAVCVSLALTGTVTISAPAAGAPSPEAAQADLVNDANGTPVPAQPYVRIVSTSTIADQVLLELIEPSRVLAVSGHTLESGREPWRYEGKIGVRRAQDIEKIIGLRPDIVFVNSFVDARHVQRMKEAGLTLFDLGPMKGLSTLLPNIEQIAHVLTVPERGRRLRARFLRELEAIAAGQPESERRRALYVGIHGDRLYGGTDGTSFHDVLVAAGLVDVATEAGYEGWPAFTHEDLLSLDAPWIITNAGQEQALCRHPGLQALTACASGQVRGVDTKLLTDPGLAMVEAAAAVRDAIYAPPALSTAPSKTEPSAQQ
jgi:iron complex transport system substrate-binding protein